MIRDTPAQLCQQVLDLVGDRAEAQVTTQQGRPALTRFANSFIHQNVGEAGVSVGLKVALPDGRVATASTTRADRAGLAALVEGTLAAAALRPVDPDWPGLAPPAPVPDVDHYDPATEDATPDERARRVRAFVDAGPGLRAAGYCDTDGGTTAFANSAGQRAEGRSTRATIDGIHQTDDSAGSGHATAARLGDLDATGVGAAAADRALRSQAAADIEPGEYEVVLEPECVSTILIFLAFYGFNAKQVIEGQSGIRLGETQFDRAVSIWDDATAPEALGVAFDADGTPKRHLELVQAGVSTALAHDRRTARKMGTESTGHAVPESDAYGPITSNLFLGPADAAFGAGTSDLIASTGRGLLVTTFNYCRILDPKTQVVTGLTRNGTFVIEDGKVLGGVKNLRFTQSFLEALAPGNVLGISREARFADSEFGPGLVHCPALRLGSWRFTGGARG
ncbi:MAG TPA: TldD/PmbA family protein [Acidimicrobiia bacterium]|jgi:predicted Zn-dependent protease|nr:TldD/PmbA family protein [Acidimicrobiia bacterium]